MWRGSGAARGGGEPKKNPVLFYTVVPCFQRVYSYSSDVGYVKGGMPVGKVGVSYIATIIQV